MPISQKRKGKTNLLREVIFFLKSNVFEGIVDVFLVNGEPAYADVDNREQGCSLNEYLLLVLAGKRVRITVERLED
ncbi:hypothetical protein [Paenibacillus polymyxa]|uniref:hypothetical protein n=1 Tax=Paenibacillus polymyxa TaxID=1406 RepID=UPI002ECFD913